MSCYNQQLDSFNSWNSLESQHILIMAEKCIFLFIFTIYKWTDSDEKCNSSGQSEITKILHLLLCLSILHCYRSRTLPNSKLVRHCLGQAMCLCLGVSENKLNTFLLKTSFSSWAAHEGRHTYGRKGLVRKIWFNRF